MFAPAHSSSFSCSHPPLLTLTSFSLTTLSQDQPLHLSYRSVNPVSRSHEMRTMALWPKHLLSQVMSPTWWSHFSRFWGYCFVLPGIECRDSQRPWRQQCGVSRCWDWRRAHQKWACFATVYTGERSWSQSEANLSLQWRRLFQDAQSILASTRQPVIWLTQKLKSCQELVDGQIRIILNWQKRKNCSQEQNPKSWDMSAERILPKITLMYWIDKLSPKHWKLGRLSQDMNSADENKVHFTKTDRWRTSTSWFSC